LAVIDSTSCFAIAGLSLRPAQIQRVFALVELRWNEGELAWASPQLFARLREERPPPQARGAGSVRRQTHDPAGGT
jgi:hypothetical protein